jgi:hypothetical protein
MAADFKCGTSYFYVSNIRFRVLIESGIEVGQRLANSTEEVQFVRKLERFHGSMFPGLGLDIDEFFTELSERKFWCVVYLNVAQEFHEARRSPASLLELTGRLRFIAECVMISQMFWQLVIVVDRDWYAIDAIKEDDRPGPFRVHGIP